MDKIGSIVSTTLSLIIIAICFLIVAFAPPAEAQAGNLCLERELFIEKLRENYGEQQVFQGINTKETSAFEMWTNPETGTWTFLRTEPSGVSCIMTGGRYYEMLVHVPVGEEM